MESLKERDRKYIWHPFEQMKGANILPIVKGEGAYVFDEEGKRYIDAFSSWWVNLHGHSHSYLVEALHSQAKELEHMAFGGFTHPQAVNFAERLVQLLPSPIAKVFYSDNGSTSVEVALKMALQYFHNQGQSRSRFIALENAYHGDTFGAMSVTARGTRGSGFNAPFERLFFDVDYIPAPNKANRTACLEKMQLLLESDEVAGFIFEPLVQGAGGMLMHDAEILSELIELCHSKEVLCIADEVMTGFGRTGKLFASEYLTTPPDIMCLSKGITGGFMAMGATAVTQGVFDAFYSDKAKDAFLHGHSYTGNALACALANANLDLMEEKSTKESIQRIQEMHKGFVQEIKHLATVREARSLGTICAIELESDGRTSYFNAKGKDAYRYFLTKGIILRPLGNIIVLLPPYCITENDLNFIYDEIIAYLS